jgi:tetratricopeptide (TPR) repeat protein
MTAAPPAASSTIPAPVTPEPGAPDLAALLAAGLAHHNAGRLGEAERAYRQILTVQSNNPEALNLMGVLALQVNKPAVALELFTQAIRAAPRQPSYYSNLGTALRRLGRLEEAVAANRQAVALDGNFADGLQNLANVLSDTLAHSEAADIVRRLLVLRPHLTDQRLQLARSLILSGRTQEALTELEALLRIAPRMAAAYVNQGVALRKLGRVDEAIASYHKALEIEPGDAGALNNLGTAFQEEVRYQEAIDCFRQSIARRPDYPDAHLNLSLVLRSEGLIDEAIAEARTAIGLNANLAEAHTSLGFCQLLKGNLEEGFAEYEWRSRMAEFPSPRRNFTTPLWDGKAPEGRTILIHDEQGVGDAIQFARYAQMVQARGATVIVECNTQLTRLLSSMPGISQVIGRFSAMPAHDAHVSLLSLPHLLGTTLDTIPGDAPYLRAEPELTSQWAQRLGAQRLGAQRLEPRRALRVGMVWAGNPEFKEDNLRSPRLESFLALMDVPGVEFYALQKGDGCRDIAVLKDRLPDHFKDLGPDIGNFADTAAIMMNLDLVISSCTAPTHLAGALARPTWTVLPVACDWRWLNHGNFTPWYPTMRLFRQERRGVWEPVIARVREALVEAATTRR